jgi:hypothetical protein
MALVTIGPTRLDRRIAQVVEDHATPGLQRSLGLLTYAADEHVLFAAALGFWLVSRRAGSRQGRAADYLALNVAFSAALPHILKTLVDQQRPDRRVHGNRHGLPLSGKADDAFPSGHAVHIGAVASGPLALLSALDTVELVARRSTCGDTRRTAGPLDNRRSGRPGTRCGDRADGLGCVAPRSGTD